MTSPQGVFILKKIIARPSKTTSNDNGKYTVSYFFADGIQRIEIDTKWAAVLAELDREEYNANHRETRRHCSLDGFDADGEFFLAGDDAVGGIAALESSLELTAALDSLSPDQRELVVQVYFNKAKQKDIAAKKGVSPAAVSGQLKTALRHLKKFFESHP